MSKGGHKPNLAKIQVKLVLLKNKVLFQICTHKWCASMFSRLQSIWKQTIPNFTDLIWSAGKKWLSFELMCALQIVTLNRYPVVTQCISWTDLICSVHQEPSRKKGVSIWAYMCSILRIHSNLSLCPSIPKFTDLILLSTPRPRPTKISFNLSLYVQYT